MAIKKPKYYIVEASALPDVFEKVVEAKRLLSTGKAATVNDATRMTGISRSAFYKYREAVMPFQDMRSSRIITFQILLHDEPGALNKLLTILAGHQANIMTINSIVPTNGSAVVTIAAETANLEVSLEDLLHELRLVHGVIKADILAG
jgi:chorismate mutase